MSNSERFEHISKVKGGLEFPGDKSISHRAVILSSLAKGKSLVKNLSAGEDVKSSLKCFRQLGVEIEIEDKVCVIKGKGFKGLNKPDSPLDAGNSGTLARLIAGILAVQKFESIITGDKSLSSRPMKRILVPLNSMGARITGTPDSTLPLRILPPENLAPINYELPVASAQVKGAVLLAGLHIDGTTTVIENSLSRNHTELMLGLKTELKDGKYYSSVSKDNYPAPGEYLIPGDISSAVFFIILTLLTPGSELLIKDVSLNPSRTGILDILIKMGGKIQVINRKESFGEFYGDILVTSSKLRNIDLSGYPVVNFIDEIPVLAVAGIFAEGDFELKSAKELRFKESDRIKAVCENLRVTGLEIDELEDGFIISGHIKKKRPAFTSFDDHRIAMAFGILSSLLEDGGKVDNFDCVKISNPGFLHQLNQVSHG
ncbi:MAG TPA: 3-phosphoshikimate 1-carboxyvinyltransferase [Ignavibacteriaceae bacterium]